MSNPTGPTDPCNVPQADELLRGLADQWHKALHTLADQWWDIPTPRRQEAVRAIGDAVEDLAPAFAALNAVKGNRP